MAVAAASPPVVEISPCHETREEIQAELIMVTYLSVLSKIIYPTAAAAGVFLPLVRLMALASCIYTQQRE